MKQNELCMVSWSGFPGSPLSLSACLVYTFTLRTEVVHSSETSGNFYHITRCHVPEDNTHGYEPWETQIQYISII
jgi:hypothetical protein